MTPIKIGQIGVTHEHSCGKWNTLKLMPGDFEMVGVVDDRPTSAAAFGDHMHAFANAKFMSEDELFALPGLQAVMVEVPNTELIPTAMKCAERGLAMHVDKPAGLDLDLFRKFLDICEEKHLPMQMGYMFRGNPAMQFCREIVERGYLGDVFEIEADMHHNYGGQVYRDYLSHFPGGIMFNLGCHLFDYIISFMGAPKGVTPFLQSTPHAQGKAVNSALAVLEYEHATAVVKSCDTVPCNKRRLRMTGTNGYVEIAPLERFDGKELAVTLHLCKAAGPYFPGEQVVHFPPQRDRYLVQLEELARLIRGQQKVASYSTEHDYLVHKVTLAAAGVLAWA